MIIIEIDNCISLAQIKDDAIAQGEHAADALIGISLQIETF